jgi:hypothetical protein
VAKNKGRQEIMARQSDLEPERGPADADAIARLNRPSSGVDLRPHDRQQVPSLLAADAAAMQAVLERGGHVARPIEVDGPSGFAPRATGAPSAGRPIAGGAIVEHRRQNQPDGAVRGKEPFANLRDSKG